MKSELLGACFLLSVSCLRASDEQIAAYIKPGLVVLSPDKKYKCWTEKQEDGGIMLKVRPNVDDSKVTNVWTSYRNLGVEWSPNSRWLAVGDNFLAAERAILIFDFSQSDHPLVYQTPISDRDQDSWWLLSWKVDKLQLKLKRERRFERKTAVVTITIGETPIKAMEK